MGNPGFLGMHAGKHECGGQKRRREVRRPEVLVSHRAYIGSSYPGNALISIRVGRMEEGKVRKGQGLSRSNYYGQRMTKIMICLEKNKGAILAGKLNYKGAWVALSGGCPV